MAISYVTSPTSASGESSSTTVATPTWSSTTGNTIIVGVSGYLGDVSSVADFMGNTYTKCGDLESGRSIWVAENTIGHASNYVVATFAEASTYRAISVAEYSGLATSSSYDTGVALSITSSGTTHTSSNITPSQAEALIVGFYAGWDGNYTLSAGTNTNLRTQAPNGACAISDRIVSSVAAYALQLTSASSTTYSILLRSFKAPGGAASIVPQAMANYRMRTA